MMRRLNVIRVRLWWERAFWVIPLVGVVLGMTILQAVSDFDEELVLSPDAIPPTLSVASATQLLAAIGGGMVTFTGFVFSFVILLLQFGSSQYSPRMVSYFLRARSTQVILAIFLATITFSFTALLEVGSFGRHDYTPVLTVVTAVALLFASLIAFIGLLHSVGSRVRVDAVLSAIGRQARHRLPVVLRPPRRAELGTNVSSRPAGERSPQLLRGSDSGQVVAIDDRALMRVARRHRLHIRLLVQVGDAARVESALMEIRTADSRPISRRLSRVLLSTVVIDQERSLRYDPFYLLRLLVDVAIKALSPAVNDPTTAVRSLDEIEGVLRVSATQPLGARRIRSAQAEVLVPSSSWADVVALGLVEIMVCGSRQPQVSRRMIALIDSLVDDVSMEQGAVLVEVKRELLTLVKDEKFSSGMTELAIRPDRQGLGGTAFGAEPLASDQGFPGRSPNAR